MNTLQQTKEEIIKNFKRGLVHSPITGGQSCGLINSKVFIESEDLGIRIEVQNWRSQLKNYELAFTLMELAMDEIIK